MFHYYFLGNPEGIGFDAPDTDYLTCIWAPLRAYLERRGVRVRTATPVRALQRRRTGGGSRPTRRRSTPGTSCWRWIPAPCAPSWRPRRSPPDWRGRPRRASSRRRSRCSRLWLDRDVAPARPTFSAVSREPTLDSVTVYSRLERPSAEWAAHTGGAIIELHSYACAEPDAAAATARMRAELQCAVARDRRRPRGAPGGAARGDGADVPTRHRGHPAPGRRGRGRGCGSRATTSTRPTCAGSWNDAALTGVLAANDVLAEVGAGPEEVRGVPQRGLLAGWLPAFAGAERRASAAG